MINEHDIKDLHEENKDKQPEPKPQSKLSFANSDFELLIECNSDESLEILLSMIPFGR